MRKTRRKSFEAVQEGSLGIDDPPQKSSIHITQAKTKKGFRRKTGESPIEIQTDIKIKKEKKQSNYTNPLLREGWLVESIQAQSFGRSFGY